MGFCLGGISLYFDFTFFVMLGLFLYLDVSVHTWWMLSALLLHEMGHLLAAWAVGVPMEEMRFSCFGVRLIRGDGILTNWRREALMYLGGPLMNLGCALVFLLIAFDSERLLIPAAVHLVMGAFQMLPVGVLDGGCLLAVLLERFCSPPMAKRMETVISAAVLLPLFLLAWMLLRGEHRNFTLLVCCSFLMLSLLSEGLLD